MQSMKVLVTGASGFLGSAVARRLLTAGYAVRVLVRESSPAANLDDLDVEIATGDLRDAGSLARALQDCTGLFHVAADYRLWVPDERTMLAINVDGTRNLMLAALDAGVERIVYTSSVAALGLRMDGPADEETPVSYEHVIGTYKKSKYLAEQEVLRLVKERELPAVIVNPSTPIGPRDIKPTPTGRVIVDAANGRIPAYVDTGLNVVHVDDAAEGHILAYQKGSIGEKYILGGEDMPLADILAEVARLCGRKPPTIRLPHAALYPVALVSEGWCRLRGGEPIATFDSIRMAKKRMFFSSDKARGSLEYAPRPAHEALRDAVDYFRARGLCA
jgi:dihydroflavonol-4-reductase